MQPYLIGTNHSSNIDLALDKVCRLYSLVDQDQLDRISRRLRCVAVTRVNSSRENAIHLVTSKSPTTQQGLINNGFQNEIANCPPSTPRSRWKCLVFIELMLTKINPTKALSQERRTAIVEVSSLIEKVSQTGCLGHPNQMTQQLIELIVVMISKGLHECARVNLASRRMSAPQA